MTERIFLFAGTSEGRLCGEFLSEAGFPADVFVATEYGKEIFPERPGLTVHEGRLGAAEMEVAFPEGCIVIDATHPYAREVSANLKAACKNRNAVYLRLLRPAGDGDLSGCVIVESAEAAADWLDRREGSVLLTTGSKELCAFAELRGFSERFYARVLPSGEAISQCRELGLSPKHIIAMQGPFSAELNAALLRQVGAKYLVSKDAGREGGFPEKLAAARRCGVTAVVIARPQEAGLSLEQVKEELRRRFGGKKPAASPAVPRFPAFIDLNGKPVLVVGGGEIASRRVETLLQFGASITVVAPDGSAAVEALAHGGKIRWERREYRDDLASRYVLAIAATTDRAVNRAVGEAAKALRIPVSVADSREESSFYFPAVVAEGNLIGGFVSKDGKGHSLVRKQTEKVRRFLRENLSGK